MCADRDRNDFARHCVELLAPLGAARSRRMFGGHGLYVDDLFVAIVAGDELFLKVDAQTRAHFESAGCRPFIYDRKGEAIAMGYWSVPGEAIESSMELLPWGRLAQGAALRARAAKTTPRRSCAKASARCDIRKRRTEPADAAGRCFSPRRRVRSPAGSVQHRARRA